jgi:hypothetical protein
MSSTFLRGGPRQTIARCRRRPEQGPHSAQFGATVNSVLIDVGNVLLPMVSSGLTTLGAWVSAHHADIVNFVQSTMPAASGSWPRRPTNTGGTSE